MPKSRFNRRGSPVGRVLLGLASLLALSGCPGALDDPERFQDTSSAGSGNNASSAGSGNNAIPAPACLTMVFSQSCGMGGCHSDVMPAGDLDLISPGVTARLINQQATFGGVLMGPGISCPPAKLVDTTTPSASWLELKLSGMQGSCGVAMPEIGSLTSAQQQCITDFINQAGADAAP